MQITLTPPDDVCERAESLARLTGRSVDEILQETLTISLQPLGETLTSPRPLADLPDADVLRAAHLQMEPQQDQRLSALLGPPLEP